MNELWEKATTVVMKLSDNSNTATGVIISCLHDYEITPHRRYSPRLPPAENLKIGTNPYS